LATEGTEDTEKGGTESKERRGWKTENRRQRRENGHLLIPDPLPY
jgi:hypothetical protein